MYWYLCQCCMVMVRAVSYSFPENKIFLEGILVRMDKQVDQLHRCHGRDVGDTEGSIQIGMRRTAVGDPSPWVCR